MNALRGAIDLAKHATPCARPKASIAVYSQRACSPDAGLQKAGRTKRRNGSDRPGAVNRGAGYDPPKRPFTIESACRTRCNMLKRNLRRNDGDDHI
jgi:hypothetical protein